MSDRTLDQPGGPSNILRAEYPATPSNTASSSRQTASRTPTLDHSRNDDGSVGISSAREFPTREVIRSVEREVHTRSARTSVLHLAMYALPFLVSFSHAIFSPHTKVEETPGLHAVYDILARGLSYQAIKGVSRQSF
jgi:hypothetical protein